MKKIIFLILILFRFSISYSEYINFNENQIKELFPSSTRFVVSLSGNWDYSNNNSTWETIKVPNVTNNSGRLIFQRQFRIEKDLLPKYDWSLYFLGVSSEVEVYVNEQFVGKFSSNYVPFSVDIPKKVLTSSNNTIKLIMTGSQDLISYQLQNDIFSPEFINGIPRDIFLIGSPQLKVSNILYNSTIDRAMTSASINISATITSKDLENLSKFSSVDSAGSKINNTKSFYINFQLKDKANGAVVASSEMLPFSIESQRTITKNYKFNISGFKTWSYSSPNLYEIVCKIYSGTNLIDENIKNFAFRLFETTNKTDNKEFLFNGEPFKFKGVYYIENFYHNGNIISGHRFDEDFRQLKILGANAIIFKYFYPNPYLLSLCDKYGIIAFIDLPLYNTPNKLLSSETVLANITNQVKNVLQVYAATPSVVAFGLGQGLDDNTNEYANFLERISKLLRNNSDKLLYKTIYPQNRLTHNENIDFFIFNPFTSHQSFDNLNALYSSVRDKLKPFPVIFSYGVAIQNDNHEGYSDPLSVEFQGYYAQNLYKIAVVNNGYGSFFCDFNDYHSLNPMLSTRAIYEKYVSKGILDLSKKNKTSFLVLKALFNEENEPLIDIGNYSNTNYLFIILSLLLIIIFFIIISRFRRFQEYFIRAVFRPYNFYADIRDQRILSPSFTYFLGLMIALTFGIFVESLFSYYKTSELFQYILMVFIPNPSFLSLLFELIWLPLIGIIFFALFYILIMYLISFIIRIFAYFKHLNIHQFDLMNIVFWGSLPVIFLLPVDIILFKLLQINSLFFNILLIFSLIIFIYSIFRILKATAVLFDITFEKVYIIGIGVIAVIFIGLYIFYQSQSNFISSLSYYFSVLIN
jgi:beta-galactosidase